MLRILFRCSEIRTGLYAHHFTFSELALKRLRYFSCSSLNFQSLITQVPFAKPLICPGNVHKHLHCCSNFSTWSSDNGPKDKSDLNKDLEAFHKKDSNDLEVLKENNLNTTEMNEAEETESQINIDEELLRYDYEEFELNDKDDSSIEPELKKKQKKSIPFPLIRGQSGIFDIEELCALLNNDNASDVCVIRVPPELKYVDFLVFATGRSKRHLQAMAANIQWTFKQKRLKSDPQTVKIEGELTDDWFALDLGNIAVHLMRASTRALYDLEQLWAVGPQFDEHTRLHSLADVNVATSLEEFSFDSELERIRKLRDEENKQRDANSSVKTKPKKKHHSKETLDSVAGWNAVN